MPEKKNDPESLGLDAIGYERELGKKGLERLGVTGDWVIVIPDNPDAVEETAACELMNFLSRSSLPRLEIIKASLPKASGQRRFLLGRWNAFPALKDLDAKGVLQVSNISAEDDGFHIKKTDMGIAIAGANPRAVLYGVHAFAEFVMDAVKGPLDIRKIPYFKKRGSAVSYFFNRYSNVSCEEFTADKAAYLARLGINQYTGEDFSPAWPYFANDNYVFHLYQLVKSDVFPFQPPPVPEVQRKLKSMSSICRRHGIDFYFELWEPTIPSAVGGVELYPKEALGKVRRPWGGDKDHMDTTLCVNSPLVQAHYRDMMGKFVREYPDIKGVTFYNMDGLDWLCTPELCERCKAACPDSPPDRFTPWESQASLVTLLRDAAHTVRPDFDLRFWPIHYSDAGSKKLCATARYDSLDMGWDNSDRTIMIPRGLKAPRPEFIEAQKVCKERGLPFYALCEFNSLECIQRSMPFPFHACETARRYKNWGVNHINEWVGPFPAHNPINALVMKEFLWDPDRDPVAFLKTLSIRQFGKAAGKLMYLAWEEIRDAFNVFEDFSFHPLCGSQQPFSIGTLTGGVPHAITPDVAGYYEVAIEVGVKVEPFKAEGFERYKQRSFLKRMETMSRHFAKAAGLAAKAVVRASDREFIEQCLYRASEAPRPTRREYAGLNHATIAMADFFCRQRVNMYRAVHLLNDRKCAVAAGDAKQVRAKENAYFDLVRADIKLQECFLDLLRGFLEMRPGLTRVGMPEAVISNLLCTTREKIDKLNAKLKELRQARGVNSPVWAPKKIYY